MPRDAGHCWLSHVVLDLTGPIETLPVIGAPPIPAAPTGLEIARRLCSQKQAYVVRLEWTDAASNETGYRVYRSGELLATLPAGSTTYTDNPPYGGPYTYAVEAYNKDAALPRATVEEMGCPKASAIEAPGTHRLRRTSSHHAGGRREPPPEATAPAVATVEGWNRRGRFLPGRPVRRAAHPWGPWPDRRQWAPAFISRTPPILRINRQPSAGCDQV